MNLCPLPSVKPGISCRGGTDGGRGGAEGGFNLFNMHPVYNINKNLNFAHIMLKMLLVALGGAVGSVLRYSAGLLVGPAAQGCFPWATFAVNVAGCLLIGALSSWSGLSLFALGTDSTRALLVTGLCGGFTTFSTFSRESLTLLESGHAGLFALYAAASVAAGLLAVAAGAWLGRLAG